MEDLIDISWDMEFDQLAGHQWEFDRFLVEDHGDFSRELIWGHNGSQRFFFFFSNDQILISHSILGTQHSQWEFLMGYKQVTMTKAL